MSGDDARRSNFAPKDAERVDSKRIPTPYEQITLYPVQGFST
jgi:hypothetical protein